MSSTGVDTAASPQVAPYLDDFAAAHAPGVPQLRDRAIERFAALGFPGKKHEQWRYTSLAGLTKSHFTPAPAPATPAVTREQVGRLALLPAGGPRLVLVDGRVVDALSDLHSAGGGVTVTPLAQRLTEPEAAALFERLGGFDAQPFVALNTAFVADGVHVHLARGTVLQAPLQLVFVSTAACAERVVHPRVIVEADSGSVATICESYVGLEPTMRYWENAVSDLAVADGANLTHVSLHQHSDAALHLTSLRARVQRAGQLTLHSVVLGGALVRNEVDVHLVGEGAGTRISGLYLPHAHQHVDYTVLVDHSAPHTTSDQLYKGVFSGHGSGIFAGKVLVRPEAQRTHAVQTSRNLLLSDGANANAKPHLEIYADDVQCAHGATVGELDATALFYLRSRGIDLDTARRILTFAFAAEVLERIAAQPVRERLEQLVQAELGATLQASSQSGSHSNQVARG